MRVLLIEDEPYIAQALKQGLEQAGFAADLAMDGHRAIELLGVNDYEVAVVDRDIPGPSGDEVVAWMHAKGLGTRILMLTAAALLDDKVSGFEAGTDDYLTKPFAMKELVLRLTALARRPAASSPPVLEGYGLRLDPFKRTVHRDGAPIALSKKQFAILQILLEADGGVISSEQLLERAWDEHADPFTAVVRVTMSSLRKRLGEPAIIETVTGVGYRLSNAGAGA
ncbi:response regulator transcription factor [Glutamicibacter sp.]|uniref:response regulator transcription factor n=1 Tax=Glutamicibacter sp. TaxID=1931995 RepID=UPI0028BD2EB0|nr:response regulator transcription factor [Glutamicibacter sp.]